MNFDRFEHYDGDELAACGRACTTEFAASVARFDDSRWSDEGAYAWTDAVLNWFASVHADGVVVDTSAPAVDSRDWDVIAMGLPDRMRRQRQGHGEFLKLDLVASRGPQLTTAAGRSSYWTEQYWREMLKLPNIEPLLALESEWKQGIDDARYACVMHSASKLAWVRARLKVLVFASRGQGLRSRDRLSDDVAKLRARAGDDRAWLLLDLPDGTWKKLRPAFAVAQGDKRPVWEST